MLGQEITRPVGAETTASGVRKEYLSITSLWLPQPSFQNGDRRLGEWCATLFATLTYHTDMRAAPQGEVLACESGHLREAQTGLYGHQEKRVIATAKPGPQIWGNEQRIDFGARKKGDHAPLKRLLGIASTRWIWAE
jgi:hypothetical protein